MILQALCGYYGRMADDPDREIPARGFGRQTVHFCLVIDRGGRLVRVRDLREARGKRVALRRTTAPTWRRTAGISPHFAWDNTGYVLGADDKGRPERASKMFATFKDFHHYLCDGVEDGGVAALLRFLDSWNPDDAGTLPRWGEMAGRNVVFQVEGGRRFLHETAAVKRIWSDFCRGLGTVVTADCLVTGRRTGVARVHPRIRGVPGAYASGAALVSFNRDAFASYGRRQGYNAPVSEEAAFAYTTALNDLLRPGGRRRIQIGDAATVFWAERKNPVEDLFGRIFEGGPAGAEEAPLRDLFAAVRSGRAAEAVGDPGTKFFVLGLSPNASRLSVRFWHAGTVGEVLENLDRHFQDLAVVRAHERHPEFPEMRRLLREVAAPQRPDGVPPVLAGAFMRAVLTGAAYPRSLLPAVIARIRADRQVNYHRASMIRACLVRRHRIDARDGMAVSVGLDRTSGNVAYRLGRLFAVLEKAGRDAAPGADAVVRDRWYGLASATPAAAFPRMLRLARHHIEKSQYGRVSDRWIEEIVPGIEAFPDCLGIEEQGLFALGYYQQKFDFYKKTEDRQEK